MLLTRFAYTLKTAVFMYHSKQKNRKQKNSYYNYLKKWIIAS